MAHCQLNRDSLQICNQSAPNLANIYQYKQALLHFIIGDRGGDFVKAKVQRLRGRAIATTNNGFPRTDPRYEETKLCFLPNGKFYLRLLSGPSSFTGDGKTWKTERRMITPEEAKFWIENTCDVTTRLLHND